MLTALDDKVRMVLSPMACRALRERLQRISLNSFSVCGGFERLVWQNHTEIFQHTHRQHISEEVPTSRILFVGDNPYSDILGGQRRLAYLWLNEHQATCPEEVKLNHTIRHLSELELVV